MWVPLRAPARYCFTASYTRCGFASAAKTSGESWISRIVSFAAFTTGTFGEGVLFSVRLRGPGSRLRASRGALLRAAFSWLGLCLLLGHG